jgi:hypothetical protein
MLTPLLCVTVVYRPSPGGVLIESKFEWNDHIFILQSLSSQIAALKLNRCPLFNISECHTRTQYKFLNNQSKLPELCNPHVTCYVTCLSCNTITRLVVHCKHVIAIERMLSL